ncbi:hypothetical protein [Pedobacter cryotolerans]|uniref:Uncharacterized protein n=1 Tax=Pedobacter cryotolerans TaxID=2571270 RepID=A0A4U1CDF4_9SPHI|nr:hypothetical protein [Pedobacter cryotolerans]TKC03307.1 hypothetical protein FA045_01690 [Pedobacter cryotolerans]
MKYLIILLLLFSTQSKAQKVTDNILLDLSLANSKLNKNEYFRVFAVKSMINAINFDKLIEAPKGYAQLVLISISINNDGAIDTAIVTTKLNQYFELKKEPTQELKTFKPITEYANSIVILPILYIRMGEKNINLDNGFLEGFAELFPTNLLNKKKNIILLKPEINPFSQIK